MSGRMIEIPVEEYTELLLVKARLEAAMIYINTDDYVNKNIVKSILTGKEKICSSEE